MAVSLPSNLSKPRSPTTTFSLIRIVRKLEKVAFEIRSTLFDIRVKEKSGR